MHNDGDNHDDDYAGYDDDGNDDSLEPLMPVDPTKNSVPDASASSWLATWPGPVV